MYLQTRGVKSLYHPVKDRPMNIIVFGSGSGTILEAILENQHRLALSAPHPLYEVRALFTDCSCRFQTIGESANIPVIYNSFVKFFRNEGVSDHQDPIIRPKYDAQNVRLILDLANKTGFSVDLIVLAGYMRLLSEHFLQHFQDKIINVHPAVLTILTDDGKRRYVGSSPVYDALQAGEPQTRSSVILIDKGVDTGPILVSGPWVHYDEGFPVTKESAKRHQEKQKAESDWPACVKAVMLIAEGRLGLDEERKVYVDGHLQQDCGHE